MAARVRVDSRLDRPDAGVDRDAWDAARDRIGRVAEVRGRHAGDAGRVLSALGVLLQGVSCCRSPPLAHQGNAFAAVELAVFSRPLALALGHSLDQRERATLLRWIVNVGCLVAGVAIWTAISKHSPYDMLGLGPPGGLSAPFRGRFVCVSRSRSVPRSGLGASWRCASPSRCGGRRYLPAVLLGAWIRHDGQPPSCSPRRLGPLSPRCALARSAG